MMRRVIITDDKQSSKGDDSEDIPWVSLGIELIKFGVSLGITYYFANKAMNILSDALDMNASNAAATQAIKKKLAERLKRPEIETMDFTPYEQKLLSEVIGADEINESFQDIGGMEDQIEEVQDNIVLPLRVWLKNRSFKHISPSPSGVLLYGSPGTGKSLTAKAIARESGATFINVKASSLMDKYVGESDKLVAGLFSLSRKLGPTVIFIDEIETLLRKRGGLGDNPGIASMQGVFLSEWDGLLTSNSSKSDMKLIENSANNNYHNTPVVVLGATNRPNDLDAAFLRRMPVKIQTRLPDVKGREAILRAQLRKEKVADDVNIANLAVCIPNFSGSDIKEFIRLATLNRTKLMLCERAQSEKLVEDKKGDVDLEDDEYPEQKPLSRADFEFALRKLLKSAKSAMSFKEQTNLEQAKELAKVVAAATKSQH